MEVMAASYGMAMFSFWLITGLSIFAVVGLVGLVFASEVKKLTCEPRWLIEVTPERTPLGGPYRVAPEQPNHVFVNLWTLLGITLGELHEKADIAWFSWTVKLQEKLEAAWNYAPFRRALHYGLFAAFLGLVFHGSAYLFGETPSMNSTIDFGMGLDYSLTLPYALSSMWDVPALFIGVMLLFGWIYLINQQTKSVRGEFGLDAIVVVLALFAVGVCFIWNLDAFQSSGQAFTLKSVALFVVGLVGCVVGIPIVFNIFVFGMYCEVSQAVGRFVKSGRLNPLAVKVNGHKTALVVLTCSLAAGLMIGVCNCGVALGLALGLAMGIIAAAAMIGLVHILTLVIRLVVVAVRVLRLRLVIEILNEFWSWLNWGELPKD